MCGSVADPEQLRRLCGRLEATRAPPHQALNRCLGQVAVPQGQPTMALEVETIPSNEQEQILGDRLAVDLLRAGDGFGVG